MIRKIIKAILPRYARDVIVKKYINRPVYNVFKRDYENRVLISYIVGPFRKVSFKHENNYSVKCIAEIFDALGYVVDVAYFEGDIPDLHNYNVIFGFGDAFTDYFEGDYIKNKKTIHYATGAHVSYQNTASLKRIKQVKQDRGVLLCKSARVVEKNWSHQSTLVDGIIALGNEFSEATHRKHFDGPIINVNVSYFQTVDPKKILNDRHIDANKTFLWFGSSGLIHKGLDLCLELFSERPDLTLHVCGLLGSEPDFISEFSKELYDTPNIKTHGFVDINSDKFKEILRSCSFIVFPSCSEGGCSAVATAVGNGALIPIVTRATTISSGSEINIDGLSLADLASAIEVAEELSEAEVRRLQLENLAYFSTEHSQQQFRENMFKAINTILDGS
ncbi:glycosyltransferase [Amylibacter sp.]|nr:glycosyltransferase [Amylibacter sp.]